MDGRTYYAGYSSAPLGSRERGHLAFSSKGTAEGLIGGGLRGSRGGLVGAIVGALLGIAPTDDERADALIARRGLPFRYAYRGLSWRDLETLEIGILARNPEAITSLDFHVLGGSGRSQYVSLTWDYWVAQTYATSNNGPGVIAKIDLSRIGNMIYDVSQGVGLSDPVAREWAIRDREVLVHMGVYRGTGAIVYP
jgi:hypothetical protein